MDHVEDKPRDQHWEACQNNVVKFLRERLLLGAAYSEEEVNHVLGVLEVLHTRSLVSVRRC